MEAQKLRYTADFGFRFSLLFEPTGFSEFFPFLPQIMTGGYLSPDQVIQLLKDMEQDPKVLEDLEGLWSNGQIAVLKKALSAAAKSGVGLLEATEVVEPNPISPNESTSYSNLYHCDRDGVYLYIDAVSGQLADAIGKNEG